MKQRGQVTVEASIVVPIILLIVTALLYLILFLHDMLILKSYAYSAATECMKENDEEVTTEMIEKLNTAPTFMVQYWSDCYLKGNEYIVEVRGTTTSSSRVIKKLVEGMTIKVKAYREMDAEKIYFVKGALDTVEGR